MEKAEKMEKIIAKRDRIRVALLKDLAGSLGALRDEFLASYKMINFDTDSMLDFFNDFIKAQELFAKLAEAPEAMGWFTFFDAPRGWFEKVACLRMIIGDDDNELGRCVTQVTVCYLKFTEALLDVNLSDF